MVCWSNVGTIRELPLRASPANRSYAYTSPERALHNLRVSPFVEEMSDRTKRARKVESLEMDPREVLLGIDLDEVKGQRRPAAPERLMSDEKKKKDDVDLLEQLKRLRKTVERDHDRRLRGIEINIRWLMVLVGGEVLAIIGFALGSIASP